MWYLVLLLEQTYYAIIGRIHNVRGSWKVLRGSKYVQSELRDTFFKVKAYLKEGKNVLFTGTPCQVDGLYRYLRRNYDNLLTFRFGMSMEYHLTTLFHSYLLKL